MVVVDSVVVIARVAFMLLADGSREMLPMPSIRVIA